MTSPELLVVVPSRGRPGNVATLAAAWRAKTTPAALLAVIVDDDDPERSRYQRVADQLHGIGYLEVGPSRRMGAILNDASARAIDSYRAVGFMGDDHRPRTHGWDVAMLAALAEPGVGLVYGDDLLQRAALPTAVAMRSSVVRALGFMVPPALQHMYVDNYWMALGQRTGSIRFLPGVVIEHVHPVARKAPMDDTYRRNDQLYGPDGAAWQTYLDAGHLDDDAARVRAVLDLDER